MLCWFVTKDLAGTQRRTGTPQVSSFLHVHLHAKGMQGCANPLTCGFTVIGKFYNIKLLKPRSSPEPEPCISLMSVNASQHMAWSRLEDSLRSHPALFSLILLISYRTRNFPFQYRCNSSPFGSFSNLH